MRVTPGVVSMVLASSLSLAACGEEKPRPDTLASASAAQNAQDGMIDNKLAKALASAKPAASANAPTGDQPPASGIFEPGVADKTLRADAPPKLEMLAEGSDPKIGLHASAVDRENVTLTILISSQGQPQIPLVFTLDVGPEATVLADPIHAAKKDGAKGEKGAAPKAATAEAAASGAPSAAPTVPPASGDVASMIAIVTAVAVVGVDKDELPKKMLEQVDSLKGARLRFTRTPTGLSKFTHEVPGDPSGTMRGPLDIHLSAIEESLSGMYTPAPTAAVGEGAMWIVTDRRPSFGSDVLRYRVFKVAKVEGDHALLSMDLRQYSANDQRPTIVAVEDQSNVVLSRYASAGKAQVELGPKSRFALGGQMQVKVAAEMVPSDQKDNPQAPRAQMQFELGCQVGILDPSQLQGPPGGGAPGPGPGGPGGGGGQRPPH